MIELFRSNDPVELSWAQAVLGDEGIASHIFDFHSSILDGSIGALPRRLMVDPDEESLAKYILDIARRDLAAHKTDLENVMNEDHDETNGHAGIITET